ncbi:uncharacterized protein LOC101862831 [Aplysia californica]|uniref:Uncharacterized protein LOC101862831 n=1 Tax=Aplysia californica TaxID=6500 RepID=A0ABM1A944_APLCA|nr:uncharacterized protein LOC101862831 [Aplysia californica]
MAGEVTEAEAEEELEAEDEQFVYQQSDGVILRIEMEGENRHRDNKRGIPRPVNDKTRLRATIPTSQTRAPAVGASSKPNAHVNPGFENDEVFAAENERRDSFGMSPSRNLQQRNRGSGGKGSNVLPQYTQYRSVESEDGGYINQTQSLHQRPTAKPRNQASNSKRDMLHSRDKRIDDPEGDLIPMREIHPKSEAKSAKENVYHEPDSPRGRKLPDLHGHQSKLPFVVKVDQVQSVPPRKQPQPPPPRLRHQNDVEDNDYGSLRPAIRSLSRMPPSLEEDSYLKLPSVVSVSRSQSLRSPTDRDPRKAKPRKLLRDLSFSDADAKTVRNYGELSGASALPRRKPIRRSAVKEEEEPEGEEATAAGYQAKISADVRSHLVTLMQELIDRGKVKQVAVIERDCEAMLASVPTWPLATSDVSGLVKAVTSTHQMMLKLFIDREMYTCFKHGKNKMVARAGDNVLVAQTTETCVVVARSLDDTPGSCLYEVAEFTDALADRGW